MSEQFTFFYNGPFSQWHMKEFKVDGVEYNCAEQYMMAQKATVFGDVVAHYQIMNTISPAKQKALGRTVVGFDVAIWSIEAKLIVYRGNLAKFKQNSSLFDTLYKTRGTTLVEASPTDTVWGIGLSESDERRLSRDTWRGTNWLGEVITKVREDLI